MWRSLIPKIKEWLPSLLDRFFPKMSLEEQTQFDPNKMACPLAALLPGRPFDDEDLIEPEDPVEERDNPEGVKIKED